MGPVPGMEDEAKPFTEEEMKQHVRSSHAVCDQRCELCAQTRGIARHPKQVQNETMNFDYATVKNVEGGVGPHTPFPRRTTRRNLR